MRHHAGARPMRSARDAAVPADLTSGRDTAKRELLRKDYRKERAFRVLGYQIRPQCSGLQAGERVKPCGCTRGDQPLTAPAVRPLTS